METKKQKISEYLRSNFQMGPDPNTLNHWIDFLAQNKHSKLSNQRLVFTSQGSLALSGLVPFRRGKKKNFRMDLYQLLERVPHETILFQKSKQDPIFPLIFLRVFLDNHSVVQAFHQRHPVFPLDDRQLQRHLEQDPYWVEKFRAGSFFKLNRLPIFFTSGMENVNIRFYTLFDLPQKLFTAELRIGQTEISDITCVTQERDIAELKFAIIYVLLTQFEYDQALLVQQIERELANFRYLVPDISMQFVNYLQARDKWKNVAKTAYHQVDQLLKTNTLSAVLLHNFLSWPLQSRASRPAWKVPK